MTRDVLWFWIAFPVCIGVFAMIEGLAILWPKRYDTLSRLCYNTGRKWPISLYMAGLFTGILIVHLFAHFCPA